MPPHYKSYSYSEKTVDVMKLLDSKFVSRVGSCVDGAKCGAIMLTRKLNFAAASGVMVNLRLRLTSFHNW